MSLISESLQGMSSIVNSVLGESCTYTQEDGTIIPNVDVTINRNKIVKGEFGVLAGYRVEASILISQVPEIRNEELITTEKGEMFRVSEVEQKTSSKYYVSVYEVI